MVVVKNEGIILEKTNLGFESEAVFNPACIEINGITHMFYRAVRAGNYSTIGYCQLKNNKVIKRLKRPLLYPEYDYERRGLEDPRIVCHGGIYYLFYIAFDGQNALIAYAKSRNLPHFVKKGVISARISYDEAIKIFREAGLKKRYETCKLYCTAIGGKQDILLWDKDAFIFPKKICGKFGLLHRILPDVQIAYFDNFADLTEKYWRNYLRNLKQFMVLEPKFSFEKMFIGGGCPPIETDEGWLLICHGTENTKEGRMYHASAVLLDLEDPTEVVGRLSRPLFSPHEPWEKLGIVNNVVFPTGTVLRDQRLFIYYGAADKLIAAKSVDLQELLNELKQDKPSLEKKEHR